MFLMRTRSSDHIVDHKSSGEVDTSDEEGNSASDEEGNMEHQSNRWVLISPTLCLLTFTREITRVLDCGVDTSLCDARLRSTLRGLPKLIA